jgi:Flp pilus assembly protein TadD
LKYAEARPLILAAVRIDPRNAERLFTLIAVELQLKQQTNARNHSVQLARFHSRNPWVLYRLGTLFIEHQMFDEAQAQLERAATALSGEIATPGLQAVQLSDLYLQLAQIRLTRQDSLAALQYLEKIQMDTLSSELKPAILDLQGTALLALGRVAEARSKHEQAAQFDSSQSEHWEHWIWTELLTGRTREASRLIAQAKKKWPRSLPIQKMASVVERELSPERAQVPFSDDWQVSGEGLVCCPCAVPCPCRSNAPPTAGHCENVGTFRIETGHYGSVPLDGLTFASAGCTMGSRVAPSVLYVTREANTDQIIALERLYQSFLPLQPFLFSNVSLKEIFFAKRNDGKTYEVAIPGSLEIKILRQIDDQGRPLFQTAAVDYFSNTIEYAKNLVYRAFDEELQLRWDFSRRQANFRVFDLQSQMYRQGMMLVQYSDGSGSFNKKQQELIQSLGLPLLHRVPGTSRRIDQSQRR